MRKIPDEEVRVLPVGNAKPASRPFSLINLRFIFSNRSLEREIPEG